MNEYRAVVEWHWQEKAEVLGEKNHTSDTLSTTNPSLTGMGPKQDLWGERPVTDHLSHGTALKSAADKDYNASVLYITEKLAVTKPTARTSSNASQQKKITYTHACMRTSLKPIFILQIRIILDS
jgi:hypothetical protein